MAAKDDFTEEEWETLQKGVTGAGLLVAVSDKSFFDTFGEAATMAKHLAAGRESSSPLVRDLGATTKHSGFSVRSSPDELEQQTTDTIRAAVGLLEQKAPDEVGAYRGFVTEVAQSVAGAKKGVAPGEEQALGTIKAALGS
jgi:hypothetical protein